jgi:hypothetical protein
MTMARTCRSSLSTAFAAPTKASSRCCRQGGDMGDYDGENMVNIWLLYGYYIDH